MAARSRQLSGTGEPPSGNPFHWVLRILRKLLLWAQPPFPDDGLIQGAIFTKANKAHLVNLSHNKRTHRFDLSTLLWNIDVNANSIPQTLLNSQHHPQVRYAPSSRESARGLRPYWWGGQN